MKRDRFPYIQSRMILLRKLSGMGLLLLLGGFIGSFYQGPGSVQAENRKSLPRKAFLSGSERSEVQLKEISSLLRKLDTRLEKIEKHTSNIDRKIQQRPQSENTIR